MFLLVELPYPIFLLLMRPWLAITLQLQKEEGQFKNDDEKKQ